MVKEEWEERTIRWTTLGSFTSAFLRNALANLLLMTCHSSVFREFSLNFSNISLWISEWSTTDRELLYIYINVVLKISNFLKREREKFDKKKTYFVRHRNVVEIGDSRNFLGHQSEELYSLSTRSTQRIWILPQNWLDCLWCTPPQISTHLSLTILYNSWKSPKSLRRPRIVYCSIFEFIDCFLFFSSGGSSSFSLSL